MTRRINEGVRTQIDDVMGLITGRIDEVTAEYVDSYVKELERKLRRANKNLFNRMAAKFFGVTSTPTLQGLPQIGSEGDVPRPGWVPLDPLYAARKPKATANQFFKRRGNLGKQFRALDADKLLGQPILKRLRGTKEKFITRDGSGKFKTIKREIVIKAFSKINLDQYANFGSDGTLETNLFRVRITEPVDSLSENKSRRRGRKSRKKTRKLRLYNKLMASGYIKRPFVGAYLKWWTNNEIRRIVENL
jgi:hypothetical protein